MTLAIVLLAAASLIFYLAQPKGIEHYERLLSQQNYDKARLGLEKELRNKPDWQDARELLAKVELAAGEPLAALVQFAALWQLGWQDESMAESFLSLCDQERSVAAITFLKNEKPSLPRAKLAVNLAMNTDLPKLMEDTLPWLHMFYTEETLLFNKALSWLQQQDPVGAWRVCGKLSDRLQIELANELYRKGELEQLIPQLLAARDPSPLNIVDFAAELGGQKGLDLVLALENAGWLPKYSNYSQIKFSLLLRAENIDHTMLAHLNWDTIKDYLEKGFGDQEEVLQLPFDVLALLKTIEEKGYTAEGNKAYQELKLKTLLQTGPFPLNPAFFSGIEKPDLLDLAEVWAAVAVFYVNYLDGESYDIKPVLTLLAILKEDKAYRNQASILEKILSPLPSPAPTRRIDIDGLGDRYWEFLSVSPDGRHLIFNAEEDVATTYWYDIVQKKLIALLPSSTIPFWDLYSDYLALCSCGEESQIFFYRRSGPKKLSQSPLEEATTVLGWHANTLYVYSPLEDGFCVEAINPQTGQRQFVRNLPYPPSLSSRGTLGYLVEKEHSLQIVLGDKSLDFSVELEGPWQLEGWLPEDKGVFLLRESRYYLLKFTDGVPIPLPLKFLEPQPQCWLDSNRVLCVYANDDDRGAAVIILNTSDMSLTHTNIYSTRNQMVGKMVCLGTEIHILK